MESKIGVTWEQKDRNEGSEGILKFLVANKELKLFLGHDNEFP
jgi:hypothetical protein